MKPTWGRVALGAQGPGPHRAGVQPQVPADGSSLSWRLEELHRELETYCLCVGMFGKGHRAGAHPSGPPQTHSWSREHLTWDGFLPCSLFHLHGELMGNGEAWLCSSPSPRCLHHCMHSPTTNWLS